MRKTKGFVALSVATITLIALTGCGATAPTLEQINSAQSLQIENAETPMAQRVIALANGSAEIISALGLKSLLVGRDIASTDKDLKSIPIVTSGHQVIAEKIISMNPDLVIIDKSTGPASALASLRSAGIAVVNIPEAWTLADIPAKVKAVAQAIGTPQGGSLLNQKFAEVLQGAENETLKKVRIAFLYLRGGSAIYLIGGQGSGADSLMQAIGAVDVGANKFAQPFTPMTSELMISLNPDLILVMSKGLASVGGVDGLVQLPGVAQTEAGKNRRVVAVDDSLLLSFGPRTPDLIKQLSVAVEKVMR
ncbi:ABC transporter substrate-binding protein [Actinobacteria bacterium IMCC25003]|nr:ABC transporter substrate-binding protein [Actinobacteria bacterium IMCC25003]